MQRASEPSVEWAAQVVGSAESGCQADDRGATSAGKGGVHGRDERRVSVQPNGIASPREEEVQTILTVVGRIEQ